jgi:hypothetical protein
MAALRIGTMRTAIDLDDQAGANAGEIGYVGSNGMLPPEAKPVYILAKLRPEKQFGTGKSATKNARTR